MADLTLADYRSLIKAYMQADRDTEDQYYPDADLNDFINRAQYDIARELGSNGPFFRATDTVDLEEDVPLPDDFLGNLKLTYLGSTGNMRINIMIVGADRADEQAPYWRDTSFATNAPPSWAAVNWSAASATLKMYPPPTTTITNGLFMSYTVKPTELEEDADESELMVYFPELQRKFIPSAVLRDALFYEAGESDDQAAKWEAIYQQCLSKARFTINTMFPSTSQYGRTFY
jgi:hypothetical protein